MSSKHIPHRTKQSFVNMLHMFLLFPQSLWDFVGALYATAPLNYIIRGALVGKRPASRLPARSVLLHIRAEVSTGDPHPLTREA